MPELINLDSEQMMRSEVFKVQYFDVFDYSHAPVGPIKEEQIEDSSELMMRKPFMIQVEQDKITEAYVTHWQELEKQDVVKQGQEFEEQNMQDIILFDQAETTGADDHNYRHESKVSQSKSVD